MLASNNCIFNFFCVLPKQERITLLSVHIRIKEHERYIRLAQTDKSTVAKRSMTTKLNYMTPSSSPPKPGTWIE
jgi:hypothetical protein